MTGFNSQKVALFSKKWDQDAEIDAIDSSVGSFTEPHRCGVSNYSEAQK